MNGIHDNNNKKMLRIQLLKFEICGKANVNYLHICIYVYQIDMMICMVTLLSKSGKFCIWKIIQPDRAGDMALSHT